MEKIAKKFYEQIKQTGLPKKADKILVCVSGGPDSVALLNLIQQTSLPFSFTLGIAHVNHGLRGASSLEEADYVQSLASKYNLPFHLLTIQRDDWENTTGTGLEEKARNIRISYFQKIRSDFSYSLIALGHTQDDLVETILFNLIRGISPETLSTLMPTYDPIRRLYRPLLLYPKKSLLAYLANQKIEYRIDATNQEVNFSRNKIRNQMIPILNEINPKAGDSILRFQKLLSLEISYIREVTKQFLNSNAVSSDQNKVVVFFEEYKNLPENIQLRIIREIRFNLTGCRNDFYFSQIKSTQKGIIDNKRFYYKDKGMHIFRDKGCIVFEKVISQIE
jgi:tRNA(Ile)-lysidine synthase